jgi:hypothetical protein
MQLKPRTIKEPKTIRVKERSLHVPAVKEQIVICLLSGLGR